MSWTKLISILYYGHKGLWVQINKQQGMSYFWRGILRQLDSFLLRTKVVVGNAVDTSFWKDYGAVILILLICLLIYSIYV